MPPELLIVLLVVALVVALVLGAWLWGVANRLDRLHVRTDAAWAGLDAALARRAVVTRIVSAAGCLEQGEADALRVAADQAEGATRGDRETAENALSRLLGELDTNAVPFALAEELSDAQQRVMLARRMHNDAVRDTKTLRQRRLVRWLRLAGTAPQPEYFEIAEPEIRASPVRRGDPRRSARIVLVDAEGRVLLFRGTDPGRPGSSFWFTPGGGVENGEDLRATAIRELREETGLTVTDAELAGPTWVRRVAVPFDGDVYRGEEWFFVVRIDRMHDVDTAGFTALETATIDGHRWWTADELVSTSDTVYPAQLGQLLPDVLADNWNGGLRTVR